MSLFFLILVILSVPLRLTQIGHPLTGDHYGRQAQTAITVWSFVEEGIRPLAYQTPIFGPPWQVPLEFPTYQLTAVIPATLGMDIDAACRLTSIFFFYLSALLLFALCRHLVPASRVAESAVFFYCWMPFSIYWSTQCMVDFASVAFALGYTLAFLKWLEKPASPVLFVLALISGALAYLTKVTTVVGFVPLIGTLILVAVFGEMRAHDGLVPYLRTRWAVIAGIAFLVLVPVICEHGWLVYSDRIKMSSPFTAWLASDNLAHWNFGSLEQRFSLSNWKTIIDRLDMALLPGLLPILVLLGCIAVKFTVPRGKVLFLAAAAGTLVAIGIFFNLYVIHNYYLMAVVAPVAVMVGFGVDFVLFRLLGKYPIAVWGLLLLVGDISTREVFPPPGDLAVYEHHFAQQLREITEPDDLLVVADRDWNPFILYHARRKGFMLRGDGYGDPKIDGDQVVRFLKEHDFDVFVTIRKNHWLPPRWPHSVAIPSIPGFFVYRLHDTEAE